MFWTLIFGSWASFECLTMESGIAKYFFIARNIALYSYCYKNLLISKHGLLMLKIIFYIRKYVDF